uniref:Acyl-CoA-binding domain-containing protein 4 n=1 Tax=Tanacetum cinerariifolium TaxID=118510 RepID=A0A6L2MFX4_TANCI|nr:acyl-CoA-binding domain-containing protein 4 [Tanacetum cinerariifolium]
MHVNASSIRNLQQLLQPSWNGLGNMASTEAMRLFVKILGEEDPEWYSRALEMLFLIVLTLSLFFLDW